MTWKEFDKKENSKFDRFCQLYKQFYSNGGPSISSSCGEVSQLNCGCWECLYDKLNKKESK